jgi:hypothetical protein
MNNNSHSVKQGKYSKANKEIDALNPSGVKDINTNYGPGRTGTLSDGRTVIVRPGSTDGRPTLEIRNPANHRGIEIRYKRKKGNGSALHKRRNYSRQEA